MSFIFVRMCVEYDAFSPPTDCLEFGLCYVCSTVFYSTLQCLQLCNSENKRIEAKLDLKSISDTALVVYVCS